MRTLPSGSFWWRREHVSKFTKDTRLIFTHTLTYTCTLPHSHTVVHTHTFSHTSLHTLLLNLQQYSCRIGLYEGNLGLKVMGISFYYFWLCQVLVVTQRIFAWGM